MYKVICTLENASENINGIDFKEENGAMVAKNVPDETALHFKKVDGFEVFEEKPTNLTDGLNYAELTVAKIKEILTNDPFLHDRVLADELADDGDPRDGVIKACEVAKEQLQGGE